ncbi:hypothetical protein [Promicromonospora soli]
MKAADFVSTPDDLLASAIRIGEHLELGGWKVKIEPFDLAYPRTPVFTAKREHTTSIVEVQSSLNAGVAAEWARFAKASSTDTRIVIGTSGTFDAASLEQLRTLGVGLLMIGTDGPYEVLPPIDLALQIELPELPAKLRSILGAAYDLFDKGQWREGFEHACTRFEQEARKYLKARVRSGAQFISSGGKPVTYSQAKIGKMTIGQLADVFAEMRSPNVPDSRLGQCLKEINPGRITAAHYKGTAIVRERKLRADVARNMFLVVNGISYSKGIRQ